MKSSKIRKIKKCELTPKEIFEIENLGYAHRHCHANGIYLGHFLLMTYQKWLSIKNDWRGRNFNYLVGQNSGDRRVLIDGRHFPVITII